MVRVTRIFDQLRRSERSELNEAAVPPGDCHGPAPVHETQKGDILRMALPSILSLAGARVSRAHAEIFSDLHRAWRICSGTPDGYDVFGPPWPMLFQPSLAWFPKQQSQGGFCYDQCSRGANG